MEGYALALSREHAELLSWTSEMLTYSASPSGADSALSQLQDWFTKYLTDFSGRYIIGEAHLAYSTFIKIVQHTVHSNFLKHLQQATVGCL